MCVCWFTYRMLKLCSRTTLNPNRRMQYYFEHTDAQVALFRLFRLWKYTHTYKHMQESKWIQYVYTFCTSTCVHLWGRSTWTLHANGEQLNKDEKNKHIRTHMCTQHDHCWPIAMHALMFLFFFIHHYYFVRIQNYSLFRSTSQLSSLLSMSETNMRANCLPLTIIKFYYALFFFPVILSFGR